jgi:antitoxin ParD1/3/4
MAHKTAISDAAPLRRLEKHETRVKALRQALVAGENSGKPVTFDGSAFLKRMRRRHVR